jgi:hypothetical protein
MGTPIVVDCEAPFGVGAPSVGDIRRPEDLVLLDLPEAVRRCQATVDREPLACVTEVRQFDLPKAVGVIRV